jgi:CIC family chloride channel protein
VTGGAGPAGDAGGVAPGESARRVPGDDPRGVEQPNVPSRLADLPPRFWVLLVLTGVAAGLGAIAMMDILRAVQHAAFGYRVGEFSAAVARRGDLRRVVVVAAGGLITGVGLWALRRFAGGTGGEPTAVVWSHEGRLALLRTLATGALSEVTVGLGGSIGREAAPQRAGAAAGAFLGRLVSLPAEQRRLLVACGAGAGLGAVYNVPFAGAFFTLEIYLGTVSLVLALPALLASGVATAVAWIGLPAHAVYALPRLAVPTLPLMVFAVLVGPLSGVAAAGYVQAITWASDHRPKGGLLLVEPLVTFAGLGALAIAYPLLLGNGVDLAQFAFTGSATLGLLVALACLKPVATAACLRSGATGGLFTPTLSFGAVLGALAGRVFLLMWHGPFGPGFALVGAAAVLSAALAAPLTGIAMTVELTHALALGAPAVLGAVGATLACRRLVLRSIYTARLPPPRSRTREVQGG